jgi:hypothetical protein
MMMNCYLVAEILYCNDEREDKPGWTRRGRPGRNKDTRSMGDCSEEPQPLIVDQNTWTDSRARILGVDALIMVMNCDLVTELFVVRILVRLGQTC